MENKLKGITLLILPLCLIIFAVFLSDCKGPYYLNTHYDPGYAYLINSLNLAQFNGYGVGHIDHPGTPLQIFGALIIKMLYIIKDPEADLVIDVLHNPEDYLKAINYSLVLLNSILLFIFGFFIFRIFRNIITAIFFQLTPFASFNVFYELSDVSAENFMMMVIILFILLSLTYNKYVNYKQKSNKKDLLFVLGFSLITGIGVATKLTFVPLMVIPFILLRRYSYRLSYLFMSVIFLFIFVSPAISSYSIFITWTKKIFGHGLSGAPAVKGPENFFLNIIELFSEEIFFSIVYFLIFFLFIIQLIISSRKDSSGFIEIKKFVKENKLLIAIFLVMNLEFLTVLKHFSMHYIFPSLMLSITALYLVIPLIKNKFDKYFKKIDTTFIYSSIIILIIVSQTFNYMSYFNYYNLRREQALKLNNFILKNYPDSIIISGYGSSNKEYAIAFTTYWAGSQTKAYKIIINQLIPDNLFFEMWYSEIFSLNNEINIRSLLLSRKEIIFQSNNEDAFNKVMSAINDIYNIPNTTFRKVFENTNGEYVYEIKYQN